MLLIEIPDHRAIFLEHNGLIRKMYKDSLSDSTAFELKSSLFSFRPKPDKLTYSSKSSRKRKRKTCLNLDTETVNLRNICNALLAKLKDVKVPVVTENSDIERFWEEGNNFPIIRGENTLNIFQNITLNDGNYIIPPRCRFFNYDILNLKQTNLMEVFDFVVIDPPWRNKYIRRIKRARRELGYKMLDTDMLATIPLDEFTNRDSIVAVWCTNSQQHQNTLIEKCFPKWNLRILHRILWLKLNTSFDLISEIGEIGKKQPYEVLFIAHRKDDQRNFNELKKLSFLLSVPSIIHSHKPPILEIFRNWLPKNPKCLELFARYLQPEFTSIGLEVLKLMDSRLYTKYEHNCN